MANKKEQKIAKIVVIVLFAILFPVGVFSVVSRVIVGPESGLQENVNHELYFKGKLWFYTETGDLLGTYTCETEKCGLATGSYDDFQYQIDSYVPTDEELTLPIQNVVFLTDQEENTAKKYFLYDIEKKVPNRSMLFKSVKNYGKGIEDDIYIVENEQGKFGVIQVTNQTTPILPFQYDFIGLPNIINDEGKIDADAFIVKQGESWSIISRNNTSLTTQMSSQIVSFQKDSLILADEGSYTLVNYQGRELINQDFKQLSFTGKYLNCFDHEGYFYIMDPATQTIIGEKLLLNESDKVRTTLNGNRLEIYINDELIDGINIS